MTDRPAGLDRLLAGLDEPRRSDMAALDQAIRHAGPSLPATVSGASIAYGAFRYRYASGREGEWAPITLAPRKAGLSLYVGGTPVERWADRLPGADCGKGCIRLRRAEDLDPGVLAEIVEWAERIDGRFLDWSEDQAGEPRIS